MAKKKPKKEVEQDFLVRLRVRLASSLHNPIGGVNLYLCQVGDHYEFTDDFRKVVRMDFGEATGELVKALIDKSHILDGGLVLVGASVEDYNARARTEAFLAERLDRPGRRLKGPIRKK